MRSAIISILLLVAFLSNAQEFNTYLLYKEKAKKYFYLKTDAKILGNYENNTLSTISMYFTDPQYMMERERILGVYIDKLDATKAGLGSLDTAGVVYNKCNNQRMSFGKLHSFGKFTLPPVYTNFSYINYAGLFAQKLKNGNLKAVCEIDYGSNKFVYINLPEAKDYSLLSPNLILFRDLNNKLGLLNEKGEIILEAKYDSCKPVFNYYIYHINTKNKILSKSWIQDMPVSMAKLVNKSTNSDYSILQNTAKPPVFLLNDSKATILVSAKYSTKPINNAVISSHFLPNPNGTSFYIIHGDNYEYDIITTYGEKPDPKLKYAYLETVRRDTTKGVDYKWTFDPKADYSKPFASVATDSLYWENIKKYKEDVSNQKKEKEEHLKKVEASSSNYTTVMTGNYESIKWEEGYKTYTGSGGFDEIMSVRTEDMNVIRVSIYFKAKAGQLEPEVHKLDMTATLAIEPTVIKGKGFGIDAKDVNGYRLFQPMPKKDEKPDINQFKKENKQNERQEISVKSISGTYNPITREIHISAEKTFGGTINITAKKTQK